MPAGHRCLSTQEIFRMASVLVTGVNGFVGQHLVEHLRSKGHEVWGVDQAMEPAHDQVTYTQCSILDTDGLRKLLGQCHPVQIYHLAAISYLPDADASPGFALETNIMGTVSLLEAVRTAAPNAGVLLVGSSKEYNTDLTSEAIPETVHPDPTSFYGVSKYAGALIGGQYVRQFGLDIRFSRSFNHTGPGQSPKFVCSDWARQVALIALGKTDAVMTVGDLNAQIDFSDVRDVVAAYESIVSRGSRGAVYNVCSGACVSLQFVLDTLVSKAGVGIEVRADDSKLRAHRTSLKLAGDNTRLVSVTGWKPKIHFEQTLDDTYQWWVRALSS